MKKVQKALFPLFLFILSFAFLFTGCAENKDLPANKWLSVSTAEGYLYDANKNIDNYVDAKEMGFNTNKMSNDDEWDTPYLRYSRVYLDVTTSCNLVGLAFELKTNADYGFSIKVEAQLYKEISLPKNWDELTDEARMIWERENRIKDRQFDTTSVTKQPNAVSFSFNPEKTNVDTSYQIRLIFTTNEEDETNNEYLKNFAIDNFIVLTQN